MSETSVEASSGLVDEAGRKISSNDTVEPLLRYIQEHPVWRHNSSTAWFSTVCWLRNPTM